jgi:hypothetical protein
MFWWTIGVTVFGGVGGLYLSIDYTFSIGRGDPLPLVTSGTIVLLCVGAFFLSLMYRMTRDRRRPALPN